MMILTKLFSGLLLVVFAFSAIGGPASDWKFHQDVFADEATEKEELRRELSEIEAEIADIQSQINNQQEEKEGLERELGVLQGTINKIQLQIRQLNLAMRETVVSAQETETAIEETVLRMDRQKDLIASLIRQMYIQDDTGIVELVLTYDTFSDFFNRVQEMHALSEGVRTTFLELQESKEGLIIQQEELDFRYIQQEQLRSAQNVKKIELATDRDRQKELVEESAGVEEEYRKVEKQRQKSAAEIRNQLFVLEGAGLAINFADAYFHAKAASGLTGVRPAFLLALLQQESSWGKNVGQCYLVDPDTGAGRGKNTGNIYPKTMKPSRDVQPFLQITAELGRDPYDTLVSCPWADFGYGGAMGPAQFIPSTWMGYKDRISALLGRSSDPWRIQDAFLASAVKLSDAGASSQTYNDEFRAAMRYFSGGRWSAWEETVYADPIMRKANQFQEDINILLSE